VWRCRSATCRPLWLMPVCSATHSNRSTRLGSPERLRRAHRGALREITSDRKVITAYQKEYELGQRSLVDLLNAQNQLFNALFHWCLPRALPLFWGLISCLRRMGGLITYVQLRPRSTPNLSMLDPFGLIPTKLPPIILRAPDVGPTNPAQVTNRANGRVFQLCFGSPARQRSCAKTRNFSDRFGR